MANTRNLRDGSITIRDGSGTPKVLVIPISDGDLAFEVSALSMVLMNRGVIDSRRSGDEVPCSISFSFTFEQWQFAAGLATGVSPRDVLAGDGGAITAGWVSTDACGPWAVTLEFKVLDPCNANKYEILTFSKVHMDKFSFKEGKDANTVSVSGTALQTKPARTYV